MMDRTDLRWFLFEEHIDMYKRDGARDEDHIADLLKDYLALYSRRHIPYGGFYFAINNISSVSSSIFRTGKRIMFQSLLYNKYSHLIREASRANQAFIFGNGLGQARMMADRHIYYCPAHKLYHDLYAGIIDRNDDLLIEAADGMKKVLGRFKPDVIVLNDDAFPDNRLTVMVAKELGIPTVEIQHGMYQTDGLINTGYYVDYLFTWGQIFTNIYLDRHIRPADRIKTLGYPFELHPGGRRAPDKPLIVCYLGQDYERFYEGKLQYKLDTVGKLKSLCDHYGLSLMYRPHPGDDRERLQMLMPDVKFTAPGESLAQTISRGDIFVSFNSTTLIEAALNGKLALQLKTYPFKTNDYQQMNICPRSFESVEEMDPYMKNISGHPDLSDFYVPVSPSFIEVPPQGPGKRFLELIDEII